MSFPLVKAAWQIDLPHGSDKLVLVALADFANTNGEAWPSLATLGRMVSRGEKAVREAIQSLEAAGHLQRQERHGKTPLYIVLPDLTPPQNDTPPHSAGGVDIGTPTPPDIAGGPLPISTGDPSPFRYPNLQEPPKNLQREPSTRERRLPKPKKEDDALPDWLPAEAWKGFLEARTAARKRPSNRARLLLIGKLDKLRSEGHDPGEVLDQSVMRGWAGLFHYPATLEDWNHAARMAAWFAEDEARHIIRKRTASWLKDAAYRGGRCRRARKIAALEGRAGASSGPDRLSPQGLFIPILEEASL